MPVTQNAFVSAQAVKSAQAVCTAAKTTYNDGANAVALLPATPNGAVVYKLSALPRATVTATELQLFRHDGTSYWFVAAASMPAHAKSQTAAPTPTDFGFSETNPLRLKASDQLFVGIGVALAGGVVFDLQYEEL